MLAQKLHDGLVAYALEPESRVCECLLTYLFLLDKWNSTYNLTAIRGLEQMLIAHLLDSLSLIKHLDGLLGPNSTLVDVGAGAGLPGIPIAILRPAIAVHLVEPVGKKAAFMRQCQAELGLHNVQVHDCRVQQLGLAAPADVIVSRAFASLRDFAEASSKLAGPTTRLLAMKGVRPDQEIENLNATNTSWRVTGIEALQVPGLDAQRCLITLEKKNDDRQSSD